MVHVKPGLCPREGLRGYIYYIIYSRYFNYEEAQRSFEAKAAQFREISQRMRRGVMNAMRSGELERLVGEMTLVLEDQVTMAFFMRFPCFSYAFPCFS